MVMEKMVQYECKVCGRRLDISRITGELYEEPVICCGLEATKVNMEEAPVAPAERPAKKKAAKKRAKKKAAKKAKKKAVKKKAAKKKATKKKAAKKKTAKKKAKKKTAKRR